ncbi:MAG: hypothetical protein E8D44_13365 [Nitrospira sp.]|nr:MAG: hypothetical protein E8D44_13365 [Nitrospira sp.]
MQIGLKFVAILVASLLSGCATGPLPRTVYTDPATIVRIQFDSKAGQGHGHPATVSPDAIRHVLQGVRVQSRNSFVPSILTGEASLGAAFSKEEQDFLGPHLSQALAEAKPDELVTFYRRISTSAVGLAITSGGLFVHGRHLYVILANNRTKPSEGMSQSIVAEIDPVDSPLLPISRTAFHATFEPATAIVPEDERWVWPYIDQGRVVVIDLVQLGRDMRSPAPRAVP